MNNHEYPMGADNQDAPWNQGETHERRFEVIVTQALSKKVSVKTNDYALDGEDVDTAGTDWRAAYDEWHFTPLDLIHECKGMAKEKLALYKAGGSECRWLEHLIEECEGWETSWEEFRGTAPARLDRKHGEGDLP